VLAGFQSGIGHLGLECIPQVVQFLLLVLDGAPVGVGVGPEGPKLQPFGLHIVSQGNRFLPGLFPQVIQLGFLLGR
jgi:hypothetical protein